MVGEMAFDFPRSPPETECELEHKKQSNEKEKKKLKWFHDVFGYENECVEEFMVKCGLVDTVLLAL